MDAQASMQEEQYGQDSWHPALIPNGESEGVEENSETLRQPVASKDTPQQQSLPYQLPFRPKSSCLKPSQSPDAEPSQYVSSVADEDIDHSVEHSSPKKSQKPSDGRGESADSDYLEEANETTTEATDAEAVGQIYKEPTTPPAPKSISSEKDTRLRDATISNTPGAVGGAVSDQAEMDRAWALEMENPHLSRLAHTGRTNSFPVVPPLRQAEPLQQHSLPQSQAEKIMEEDEILASLDHEQGDNPDTVVNASQEASLGSFAPDIDAEDEGFFTKALAVANVVEAEVESRYEEGLPLMHASLPIGSSTLFSGQDDGEGAKGISQPDNDDDFFSQVSPAPADTGSSVKPYALDRKSTTQVLDSMHFAPHNVNHSDSAAVEEPPSLTNMDEEGTTGSVDTNKAQIVAGPNDSQDEPKPKAEDLAELWKAALGDDDLLDEDESSLDPSAFFEDDGEGFLEGNQGRAEEDSKQMVASVSLLKSESRRNESLDTVDSLRGLQNRYTPSLQATPLQQSHKPSSAQFVDQIQRPSYATQTFSRPQMPVSTQSFADKAKGGYTSPYDLPMDVTRAKKRNVHQQMRPNSEAQTAVKPPPPPRSSSMFTGTPPQLDNQPPVPRLPPPNSYTSTQAGSTVAPSPSIGSFFEELPSSKSRPPSSLNRSLPPIPQQLPPPRMSSPARQSSLPQQPDSKFSGSSQQYQLLPPEKMSLYSNVGQTEPTSQAVPATSSRYSPVPPKPSNIPPPHHRYAASPSGGGRPPPSQSLPFQPRTSSPLAQNYTLQQQQQQIPLNDPSRRRPQSSSSLGAGVSSHDMPSPSYPFPSSNQNQQNLASTLHQQQNTATVPGHSQWSQSSPPLAVTQRASLDSFAPDSTKLVASQEPLHFASDYPSSNIQNGDVHSPANELRDYRPPKRSQTQSPGAGKSTIEPMNTHNQYQRPASVTHQMSLPSTGASLPATYQGRPQRGILPTVNNYMEPSDGRELDPLKRWKGCPIISFGFGGAVVTSFPRQVPRYKAGESTTLIKCSPGEVKWQDAKILSLEEDTATFPGPLKSKSKKKELLEWLQRRISRMEVDRGFSTNGLNLPDMSKRHEEKVCLWKIVRTLVEHDGAVEGNVENAARSILTPELAQGDMAQISNSALVGISRHSGSNGILTSARPEAMEEIRKMLLRGEREKAVWHAVDNRLWAHAMLLASTLDKTIWKQVSQEFVRQEVKTFGENTEALAALYQVFAGNWDESIDELVPPSARAGLQMVSKTTSTGPTKNALDGLDRWRETLTLILSNRSPEDGKALINLGQLLAGYGRTEAAHICYIFAKSPGLFGGPDDPQVAVALLGADHLQQPFDYGRDLDSILLTEVYDFARTVLASSSAATVSPHLQSFKLFHAMILAEHGLKSEAQQYCEAITSTFNSTTKRSPYYHNLLLGALENLGERLRQAPRDNSGSWISKPSIDKVSGSIWAKFNQYVAGDESDAASTGSGKAHDGPFAAVIAGGSPTLSRTPSSNDLHTAYNPGLNASPAALTANPSNSRYAPPGLYNPRPSLEQQGRPSQDFPRPMLSESLRPSYLQQQYQPRPVSSSGSYQEPYRSTSPPLYSSHPETYLPTAPSGPEHMPIARPEEHPPSFYPQGTYQPNPSLEPHLIQSSDKSQPRESVSNSYEPSTSAYDHASSSSQPSNTMNSYEPGPPYVYEPPSYDTEALETEQPPDTAKPKKKSFMDDDDDDDFEARAAALRKEEKLRKDRETEEAFKRVAEADGECSLHSVFYASTDSKTAQKDKAPKLKSQKSGWFGGWLGGKKESDDIHGTPNAPIKAKLGEQNSFYYDSEQKRWVNKKDPDATPAVKAAQPPPKGPPSRSVSAAGGLPPSLSATPPVPPLPAAMTVTPPTSSPRPSVPSAPSNMSTPNITSLHPSRSQSPATMPEPAVEGAASHPAPASGPPSGPPSAPPSRPATGMGGASNIDDLIGAPQARKGGTIKKAKKGRGYVDVMAK